VLHFAVALRTTPLGCLATGGVAWTASRPHRPARPQPIRSGVHEPLPVVDLPEPEEVFGVPRLGRKEAVKFFLNLMFDQLTGEALIQF
jgi:hypothetical protein